MLFIDILGYSIFYLKKKKKKKEEEEKKRILNDITIKMFCIRVLVYKYGHYIFDRRQTKLTHFINSLLCKISDHINGREI